MPATALHYSPLPSGTAQRRQADTGMARRRRAGCAAALSALAAALAPVPARAQMTFTCAAFGRDCSDRILDAQPAGVVSAITVPHGTCSSIGDVNVAVQVHHTWVGDLVATLAHRETTRTATLLDRPGLPGTTPFGCPGEDIDATIDDDAVMPVASACAGSIPAIVGPQRPPAVGCPLYLNSDSARFAFSCRFRGGWNTACGNNQLLAEVSSDGKQLTVRFPTVNGAPLFTALVQSPVAAQLDHVTIGAAPPTPISGAVALEAAGATLVLDPATVPFSINGCAVERYVGSFDGFAGSPPPIDSARPLSVFDGEACDGTWELTVIDAAGANTGKLLGWSLMLAPEATPTPSPISATPTATASVTHTATASRTPTVAGTTSTTATATATPSAVPTGTATASRSPTPHTTLTATVTATEVTPVAGTATASRSPTPHNTLTATGTSTATTITPVGGTATSTAPATATAPPPTSTDTETPTAQPTSAVCVGDCDGSGEVRINELILGVRIALDSAPVGACPAFDRDGSGAVEINELIAAVNNALRGCAGAV